MNLLPHSLLDTWWREGRRGGLLAPVAFNLHAWDQGKYLPHHFATGFCCILFYLFTQGAAGNEGAGPVLCEMVHSCILRRIEHPVVTKPGGGGEQKLDSPFLKPSH